MPNDVSHQVSGLWALEVFVSAMTFVVLRLVREQYEYHVTGDPNHGPAIGRPATALAEVDMNGRPVAPIPEEGFRILLFLSRSCGACREAMKLMPELAARRGLQIVLVAGDTEERAAAFFEKHASEEVPARVTVLADSERETFRAYRVTNTPFTVVVDPAGIVAAKGSASRMDEMDRLLGRAGARPAAHGRAAPREPAARE